jgi:hypothetical protein
MREKRRGSSSSQDRSPALDDPAHGAIVEWDDIPLDQPVESAVHTKHPNTPLGAASDGSSDRRVHPRSVATTRQYADSHLLISVHSPSPFERSSVSFSLK